MWLCTVMCYISVYFYYFYVLYIEWSVRGRNGWIKQCELYKRAIVPTCAECMPLQLLGPEKHRKNYFIKLLLP